MEMRKKLVGMVLATFFCVSSPTGAKNNLDLPGRSQVPAQTAASFGAASEIYNTNLADANTYWGTVLSNERVRYVPGNGIVSKGPFYIDVNHREGALLTGPLVVWVNGYRRPDENHVPRGALDLRRTTIRFDLKLEHTPIENEYDFMAGGKIVFWFQARLKREAVAGGDYEMPTRIANYIYTKNLLQDAVDGRKAQIMAVPDLNQWACLGSNPTDLRPQVGSAAKYTCALDQTEFEEAMAEPINMGFLILLPPKTPDGKKLNWLNASAPARTLALPETSLTLREFTVGREGKPESDGTMGAIAMTTQLQ